MDKTITFNLLRSVANAVTAFEDDKDRIGKAIKELQDEVNSLKRARDETVAYVGKRVKRTLGCWESVELVLPERGGSGWR